ncbi:hypothetical protein, partial [Streptococcus thermophilus]|uniref:hypothetical protein n=1 Tax=Streptococcus thermophilus TaxID=1308 RepID=UPI001E546A8A
MNFCYTVLVMLLELNLTGKSITWLKMILTKSSVNIRLTSGNMGSLSTVVGDEKLTSREDRIGPLFMYVQCDEDTF